MLWSIIIHMAMNGPTPDKKIDIPVLANPSIAYADPDQCAQVVAQVKAAIGSDVPNMECKAIPVDGGKKALTL